VIFARWRITLGVFEIGIPASYRSDQDTVRDSLEDQGKVFDGLSVAKGAMGESGGAGLDVDVSGL